MINNRQNGRRRGRGGGPRTPNQGPNPGNRQENRSRGNAAQLLEKYKSLARDSQMQGDRVQTEYWLQFAEHYYRMLNENRARFEEQRPRREDFADDEEGDEETLAAGAEGEEAGDGDEERGGQSERQDRFDRPFRGDQERGRRDFRRDREGRDGREDRDGRDGREGRDYREARNGEPRQERRPRDERPQQRAASETGERISLEVLPPAISVVEGDAPAKAPRRSRRRPRDDDAGEEIAPAA